MVSKGQFLERPTVFRVAGTALEALWHRGNRLPGLLVLPPTPEEGGSMDHVVAAELAWAAATAGFPSLRFNYRGVGASRGKRAKAPGRLSDALGALELLRANIDSPAVVVASLGASAQTALRLARKSNARGTFVVSPPPLEKDEVLAQAGPLVVAAGALDSRPPSWLSEAGARVELVPGADSAFLKNLPVLGRLLVTFLEHVEARNMP